MKKHIQILIGLAVGVFLMWFLFKDTDWSEVWTAFKAADFMWLFFGMAVILLSFLIRIWRWGYIVNPVVRVPFWSMFSATQIGFLGNFILPARIGEVIRAIALSRSRNIPIAKTMAFVAVDRLTDLFGLVAVFAVTLLVFRPAKDVYLPPEMQGLYGGPISRGMIQGAVFSMTAVLLGGVGVMIALIARKNFFLSISDAVLSRISKRLAHTVHRLFNHFAEGMQVLMSFKDLAKASGVSLMLWGSFALSQAAVYKSFGLDVPWYTPFVVLSLLSVFISIPGPPGFIGPFHAGIVGGLILVNAGINLNTARAVAIVAHLFNLVPIIIIGIICLSFERLELRQLAQDGESLAASKEEEEEEN